MEPAPVLIRDIRRRMEAPVAKGFTLVEMTVVLAIVAVITVIALTSQSTFNRSLVLTDTTYSMAFSAREAQSYGSASHKYGTYQNPGYGLHFDSVLPSSYILFADTQSTGFAAISGCPLGTTGTPTAKPGNCHYDTGSDGVVQTYAFNRGFKITQFCGVASGTRICSTDSTFPMTKLDIVYTRPNTSAFITGTRSSGTSASYSCADVTITDNTGAYSRSVRFSNLGEISIAQTCS